MIRGQAVRNDVVEKLAKALSAQHATVSISKIPQGGGLPLTILTRPLSRWAGVAFSRPEIGGDLCELVEGCLQVLDNFGCQNGGVRQIGRIVQTIVPEPEDI
jgi:hypothetical protein